MTYKASPMLTFKVGAFFSSRVIPSQSNSLLMPSCQHCLAPIAKPAPPMVPCSLLVLAVLPRSAIGALHAVRRSGWRDVQVDAAVGAGRVLGVALGVLSPSVVAGHRTRIRESHEQSTLWGDGHLARARRDTHPRSVGTRLPKCFPGFPNPSRHLEVVPQMGSGP